MTVAVVEGPTVKSYGTKRCCVGDKHARSVDAAQRAEAPTSRIPYRIKQKCTGGGPHHPSRWR
jgi:hypothetical protein